MIKEVVDLFDTHKSCMNNMFKIPSYEEYVDSLRNSPYKIEDIEAVLSLDIASISNDELRNCVEDWIHVIEKVAGNPIAHSTEGMKKAWDAVYHRKETILAVYKNITNTHGHIDVTEFLDTEFPDVRTFTETGMFNTLVSYLESNIEEETK